VKEEDKKTKLQRIVEPIRGALWFGRPIPSIHPFFKVGDFEPRSLLGGVTSGPWAKRCAVGVVRGICDQSA
jgi:hypothetical protein